MSEVNISELYPACPEEQCSEHTEQGLTCVAICKHTYDSEYKTDSTHSESRIIELLVCEEMLHKDHQSVPERHRKKHYEERE